MSVNVTDFRERYGPVAVVTGASSGIGRAFARQLAQWGFDLVLVARRVERLRALADEMGTAHGTQSTILDLDLADPGAVQAILDATASLDVGLVISNAGFGFKGEHTQADGQLLIDILTVNSHMPMMLSHGFIPRLKARGKGGIIMISSVEGLMGAPYSAVYGASKAFVNSLGEALWAEMSPEGIDILTICPGATDTEAPAKQGIDPATMVAVMQPEEVALFSFENITNGPVLVSSDYYREMFEQMTAMPRRDALTAMAGAIKSAITQQG